MTEEISIFTRRWPGLTESWKITPIPGKWTGYLFPIRLNWPNRWKIFRWKQICMRSLWLRMRTPEWNTSPSSGWLYLRCTKGGGCCWQIRGRLLCCRWSGMTRSFTKTLIVWPMMQIWQAVQSDYTNIGRLGRKMWDRCLWLARKDRNIP